MTEPASDAPYVEGPTTNTLKRILIVTPLLPPEPGGPSYYAHALSKALERQGTSVSLIAFREVRHLPSVLRHLVFLGKVHKRARDADVLIVLDTVSVALPAVLAAALAQKPVIVRTGGDFIWERYIERTGDKVLLSEFYTDDRSLTWKERLLLWLERWVVFRLASVLVFSTEWQRAIWKRPFALVLERTAVIENCYPERVGGPSTAPAGTTYLCAWRPTAFKNVDQLERAYELARPDLDPRHALEILRGVPRTELYERLQQARALVIPSLSEVSPNLALEALSFGVPVLLTRDCGIRDRLGDSVRYLDPKDPSDIARCLRELSDEPTWRDACARARAFSHVHTYDDIAREFLVLCNSL